MCPSVQGATATPATPSAAADCLNLRMHPVSGLMPVKAGAELVKTAHKPVIADRRDDTIYFFSIDADLTLYMECALMASGEVDTACHYRLGSLPAAIEQYAVSGEFLVLRLADGSLHYILYDHSTLQYTLLGALPTFGAIGIAMGNTSQFSAEVASARFSSVQADPRKLDPSAYAENTVKAVRRAFDDASAAAQYSGYWTQPVAVRLAWRLWDGSLLHVSDPVAVPGADVQNGGRLSLAFSTTDKGYTGTLGGTLTLTGYKIQVTLPEAMPEQWTDVISSLEVWVSRQPEALTGDATLGVHIVGAESALNVTLVRRSADDVVADALAAPSQLMERLSSAAALSVIDIRREPVRGSILEPAAIPVAMPAAASVIAAHGDFLHAIHGRILYTSRRGNPFICASWSDSPGGRVRAIAAQPIGGGAYTRQFVYLFTDHYIMAVTHDSEGRHTNLRPVSTHVVRSEQFVTSTAGGVCALSEKGTLIRINDAGVKVLMRGMDGYKGIAYCFDHNELWLFPQEQKRRWLAICLDNFPELYASFRSQPVDTLPCSCGQALFCFDAGAISEPESAMAEKMPVEWNGFPQRPPLPGHYEIVTDAWIEDSSATLTLWYHPGCSSPAMPSASILRRYTLQGSSVGYMCRELIMPVLPGTISLSIGGRLERLGDIEITPIYAGLPGPARKGRGVQPNPGYPGYTCI